MNQLLKLKDSEYFKQAELMVQAMGQVVKEKEFAVKGGTAINLFVRDMPRLSVDIDLTYLPIEKRDVSLKKMGSHLNQIAINIERNIPKTKVLRVKSSGFQYVTKLVVQRQDVKIKIEPNTIIRGSAYPPELRDLTKKAETAFDLFVSAQTLSFADLFGGKICAALDRQHPRDLFDVKILLENEGVTPEVRKAFVVYLASHDRPMNELLTPTPKNTLHTFQNEFLGMTTISVKYNDLQKTLKVLVATLRKELSQSERKFLVSLKEGNPEWGLLEIPNIEQLLAIRWKLKNIQKMDKKKHARALSELKRKLEI